MRYAVWILVVVLLVLQQDYWQWDNTELLFGFLPYTLAYHAGISLAAALVWVLAVNFCWPAGLDEIESAEAEEAADASEGDGQP